MWILRAWTGPALVVGALAACDPVDEDIDATDRVEAEAEREPSGAAQELAAPADPAAAPFVELRSEMNHKCLDIHDFNNANGAQVVMWDCWGGANQSWTWDGEQIRSRMNNKCLDIFELSNANGARVVMWDCWGGANQRWYWDGPQIRSRLNNKCLDISELSNANGARIVMWDCWGGANQRWYPR